MDSRAQTCEKSRVPANDCGLFYKSKSADRLPQAGGFNKSKEHSTQL